MCDKKNKSKCEHPEKLKGKKPSECSKEQLTECHGKEALKKGHCCTDKEE